ncbi:MAG: molybdopterin-containing oxidoreductase family protein [Syntrophothermus sp.]
MLKETGKTAENYTKTACPLNCYDTCGMLAYVKDGRVVRLEGDPDHEITRGFICRKGRDFVERTYAPDRLLYPQRKVGNGWERISWDQACALMAEKLLAARERYGSLAIFHNYDYGSQGLLRALDQRFFNALGGVTSTVGSLCWSAGLAAQEYDFGAYAAHDPLDHLNARTIVIWGRNPAYTNIHLIPIIQEARRRGARVALVDPVRTKTASFADLVVQPRPGTDGALALAMASVIIEDGLADLAYIHEHVHGFEEFRKLAGEFPPERVEGIAGVSAATIRELARFYGEIKPASLLIGMGLQRHTNGGQTIRAIDALAAITGNIGIPGGGANYAHSNLSGFGEIKGRELARQRREIIRAQLGEGLLNAQDPTVQVAVITRSNPVAQSPATPKIIEVFQKIPFVVVIDQFMTDTAEMADLVLPCTTFLEEEDIYANSWHNWLAYGPKVVEPRGESKSDVVIFTELAQRMGLGSYFNRSITQWMEDLLAPLNRYGVTLERLKQAPMRFPAAPQVAWADQKFLTPSGKYELFSEKAQANGLDPLPRYREPREAPESYKAPVSAASAEDAVGEKGAPRGAKYPLYLLTPHMQVQTHSQFANLASRREMEETKLPWVHLHPRAALDRGLEEGNWVEVTSPRGSLRARVRVDSAVREDVALIYEGYWLKYGGGVNLLTADYVSDMGLQAAFYDCLCEVSKTGG